MYTTQWTTGGSMSSKWFLAAGVLATVTTGAVMAQDTTRENARYCGLGVQGTLDSFRASNPILAHFYENPQFRYNVYQKLFNSTQSPDWQIILEDKENSFGATRLGLSHVLTFENIDTQPFVDPRDSMPYYNVSYSFGVNTVLFDTNDRQIRALIPAIIIYNETLKNPPTKDQKYAAIETVFNGIGVPESAMERWLDSIKRLPIRYDERTFFQVMPLELSDDVSNALSAMSTAEAQNPALFIKKLTTQFEALLAVTFGKPVVPIAINNDGSVASGNQYVANIPECLDSTSALVMPDPTYKIGLAVDQLATSNYRHELPASVGGFETTQIQHEYAYGARFRSTIFQFDNLNGETPLDAQTFKFQKSVRFSGQREVNNYEQYSKLTSFFMRELLKTYTTQDKKWIKDHMSAAVVDKKQRDAGKIAKNWKTLIANRMQITPPVVEEEDDEDEDDKKD